MPEAGADTEVADLQVGATQVADMHRERGTTPASITERATAAEATLAARTAPTTAANTWLRATTTTVVHRGSTTVAGAGQLQPPAFSATRTVGSSGRRRPKASFDGLIRARRMAAPPVPALGK